MEYVFFINPMAGAGKGLADLETNIKKIFPTENTTIYRTVDQLDGEVASRRFAFNLKGKETIFFAVGGDGTINEVLNGIEGYPNISLGIIPTGSGNDTVKNYSNLDFLDLNCQYNGNSIYVDAIKCQCKYKGKEIIRYCINMINIGFDSYVVECANKIKKCKFIYGTVAYDISILLNFIRKKGISLKVVGDGKEYIDHKVLLCSVANGAYCGGGFYSSPKSRLDDGLIELNIVENVSRSKFLKLISKYKDGTYVEDEKARECTVLDRCKEVSIVSLEGDFPVSIDGEIIHVDSLNLSVVKNKIKLHLPSAYK